MTITFRAVVYYWIRHLTFFFQLVFISWMDLSLRRTNMVVYTLEQCWEILRHCFENHGNVAECVRKLRTDFGRREAPCSLSCERNWNQSVKSQKTLRTADNIAVVAESVCAAPSTSIHNSHNSVLNNWTFRRHPWDEFCIRPWYDFIQSSIDSGVEANWPSNAFSLR